MLDTRHMSQTFKKHSPRQELLKIEKKIYAQNQLTIKDSSRVTDKNFKVYYRAYKKAIRHYTKSVTPEVVEADIARSRVVFVGDYHTLDQSQRSFVRILRSFFRHQHKEVIICIEAVQQRHQKHLNEFLSGTSDKDTFIKKIGFKAHWFFDLWENYSIIFDFLRYHKIPVFGIEMNSADKRSLKERDAFMAEQIVARAAEHPNKVVFVLVGDLHLAPPHLPREVNQRADKAKLNLPQVLLYQNSPEIYWQLSQKNIVDHTLIVKTGQGAYCRMHTPPIIVQQSYINWLYHEEGVFDWVDPKASFLLIVEQIAKILQLQLPADYAEVEVYTCGDLGFMRLTSFKKKFSKKELKFIQSQLLGSESYFMPQARIVYIANVSIHHAAEEASHYV
ncbi:MAG TPA: ChaN family lipoprotein, partial [bacterium]|nr:ChaN family lipoprotein [bacterium]